MSNRGFTDVFRIWFPELRAKALRLLHGRLRQDASDLAISTLGAIHRAKRYWKDLPLPEKERYWWGIFYNKLALIFLKYLGPDGSKPQLVHFPKSPDGKPVDFASPVDSPSALASLKCSCDTFASSLNQTDQRIFALLLQGCLPSQIADQLGLNTYHVARRITLIEERLKALLDPHGSNMQ